MAEGYVYQDLTYLKEEDLMKIPLKKYSGLIGPEHAGHLERMLIPEDWKNFCLDAMAERITLEYSMILSPGDALVVVPLLNGAKTFESELSLRLRIPIETDTLKVETYHGGSSTSGEVKIHKDLSRPVKDRHVLIVEDIVDTGGTIDFVKNGLLYHKRPKSVRLASFLNKVDARVVDVPVEYTGFNVPDMFVVGYGLDYKHRLRNLPFVGVYKP